MEDTALEGVNLENATVTAGNITAGKITIADIIYKISKEIAIADVVTGSDEEDSSVAGSEANTTKIVSPNTDSQFEIGNNKSYVGGSLKAQRSTVPTAGKSTLSPGTGEYISIDVSDNIKESMEWVVINLTYDENKISSGIEESEMRLNWYNESSDEWVRLESAGNPSWCYGAGVNTDENYVWANVSHFSEYGVATTSEVPYFNLSLSAGWHLISTPYSIEPMNERIIRETQGLNFTICEYDPVTKSYPSGISVDLKPLHGYWICMYEPGTIIFMKSTEQRPIPPQNDLKEGWNMIGPSFGDEDPLEEGLNATTVLKSLRKDGYTTFSHLILYNETTGTYTTYDASIRWEDLIVAWKELKLYSGQGCWIGMIEDDTLIGRL